MNDEIILGVLQEIKENQKAMVSELAKMHDAQIEIKTELAISRNGYTPHQIVELLHWVEREKERAEQQSENIRKAIISWIVPILCSAVVIGLVTMYIK